MAKKKSDPDELLGPTVAAQILECSTPTVKNLAERGFLNAVPIAGGRQVYRRGELERLAVARATERAARAQEMAGRRKGPKIARPPGTP
jgi:hypothetical protein